MSGNLEAGEDHKLQDLKELEYIGELYHYTNGAACRGIFCHKDCLNYPEDCISLRFKRIDCMVRNDSSERRHIDKAVKRIAMKLSESGKICKDFLKILCDYEPTTEGIYKVTLDERGNPFYNLPDRPSQLRLVGFGPVDYYVACFSTNPNNEHIVQEFKSTVRITFNTKFSRIFTNPFSRVSAPIGYSGLFLILVIIHIH